MPAIRPHAFGLMVFLGANTPLLLKQLCNHSCTYEFSGTCHDVMVDLVAMRESRKSLYQHKHYSLCIENAGNIAPLSYCLSRIQNRTG